MLESKFQRELKQDIKDLFPGCIILKNDANYKPGFPDLLILFNDRWAVLEVKADRTSPYRPNQEYYLGLCGEMSYAATVYEENKEDVLHDLQLALRPRRSTRAVKR